MHSSHIQRVSNYARHIAWCFRNTRGGYGRTTAMSLAYLGLHMRLFKQKSQVMTLQFRDFDVDLDIYSREVAGFWEIFQENQYLDLPLPAPGQKRVVLDVGANVGFFSIRQMLRFGGDLKLIAFEPDPVTYERLRRNVERIRARTASDIRCVNQAVDARTGEALFVRDVSVESHVVDEPAGVPAIQVRLTTLDDVVAQERIERIDLLKVDVEGHELKVLDGGRDRALPITDNITLEYHQPGFVRDITQRLRPYGFQVVGHNAAKAILSFSKAAPASVQ